MKHVIYSGFATFDHFVVQEVFQEVAQTHIMTAWCYSLQSKDIQEEHGLDEKPHLLVFKDGNSYVYDDLRGIDLAAMSEWIKQEQYEILQL
eukprot:m.11662 g.11662  ORF g.11662 m.11662 type:complete len:91 (+) comp23538_c0_seq4:487-759(+)